MLVFYQLKPIAYLAMPRYYAAALCVLSVRRSVYSSVSYGLLT